MSEATKRDTGGDSACSAAWAWGSVAILVIFSQLSIMDRQIISLLVDPIKQDLQLSDTALGLLQGLAFAVMYSLAGLPIGWAVDRYPRRIIIFLGVIVWSVSATCCGLARNFLQLFLARAAVGIGEAVVTPVSVSLISDIFPSHKVGRALGVYSAGYSIGTGLALLIGGAIIGLFVGQATVAIPLIGDVAPWQAVLIVTGLPGLLIALLAFALFEPSRPRTATPLLAGDGKMRNDAFLPFLKEHGVVLAFAYGSFTLSTLVAYAIAGWTPAFIGRTFGWDAQDIGPAFGLAAGGGGVAGSLLGGLLIDYFHRRGHLDASLRVAGWCMIASMPLLVSAYFMPSPTLVLIMIAIGCTIFQASGPAAYATWRLIAPPHMRGRVTAGFMFLANMFGTGLGPLVVGFSTDHVFGSDAKVGMSIALVTGVILPLAAVLLFGARRAIRKTLSSPSYATANASA